MNWTKMKLNFKMEIGLIVMTSILCVILLLKILHGLKSVLPWRVNCWFCNRNTWVKYPEHNSWTCPCCEQYNGFTKDGDYNKAIMTTNENVSKSPKVFQRSPPRNGLCKMCNINQQLKVIQLANFVPMNDKNFDDEIEAYRMQLEKAYKLCSPCRRVVQVKLHKEKETLLSTKLLENRSPEKKQQKEKTQSKALRDLINNTSMLIAAILFTMVSYELYLKVMDIENFPKTMNNVIEIVNGLLDRLGSIIKMKIFTTFPSVEFYYNEINSKEYIDMLPKNYFKLETFDYVNSSSRMMIQKCLGVIACLMQILANIGNVNTLRYTVAIDLLWTVFVLSIAEVVTLNPLLTIVMKMTSILMLLLLYKNIKKPGRNITKKQSSPIPIKKLANSPLSALTEQDDAMALDSDDDVSLSKFGLHNLSESSNDTISPLSSSLKTGRTFSPRTDSMWTKPKLNSTFCVNNVMCSPNSTAETVFAKPSFKKYQKLIKDDSDSDLDESISSLSLGGPTKSRNKTNSIFSLRKFTASPNFVTPMATSRGRPLISPSKLGHSTSWVAGGYWGAESDRQNMFAVDGSRSSSQSSGFESQTSSLNARNLFSQPPSREESVCGEPAPALLDRFTIGSYHSPTPQNFSRMSLPVFPQMQYNGHVHIPHVRFPHHPTQNLFIHHSQYVQNDMFKTPGASGLIKLPQVNSFATH